MIHLDTNYLIGLLVKGSAAALQVDGWLAAGESLAASAIAWTQFLNGPVTPLEASRAKAALQSRIIPFGHPSAHSQSFPSSHLAEYDPLLNHFHLMLEMRSEPSGSNHAGMIVSMRCRPFLR